MTVAEKKEKQKKQSTPFTSIENNDEANRILEEGKIHTPSVRIDPPPSNVDVIVKVDGKEIEPQFGERIGDPVLEVEQLLYAVLSQSPEKAKKLYCSMRDRIEQFKNDETKWVSVVSLISKDIFRLIK